MNTKKKTPRKHYGKQIRIDNEHWELLTRIAEVDGRTMQETLRRAIQDRARALKIA